MDKTQSLPQIRKNTRLENSYLGKLECTKWCRVSTNQVLCEYRKRSIVAGIGVGRGRWRSSLWGGRWLSWTRKAESWVWIEGLLVRGSYVRMTWGWAFTERITLSDWLSTQAVIMISKVSIFNVLVICKMFTIHKVQCKLLYFRATKTIMITCQKLKLSLSPTTERELMSFFVSMAFSTLYNGIYLKVSQ